jgi:hypothetical protein
VLLTYTGRVTHLVKYGKILFCDRRKYKSTLKGNYPLSFENWIFRNDQPVRDGNHRSFVVMTST